MSWTQKARASTTAGFAARLDTSDKSDRLTDTKGASTSSALSQEDLKQVQEIWGEHTEAYGDFLSRFQACMEKRAFVDRPENVNDWTSRERTATEGSGKR